MRFIHISDTHLGYHQYGLKERSEDFFDVFNEAVDFAIEKKVDFVIHTGDFFHSSRPSNHVILQGMEILERLRDANIPIFVISGNHDRGSQVRDISPLKILQPLGLNLVDSGVLEYEGLFIGGLKYISKAGLRQIEGIKKILEKYLEEMGNGFRILLLHQEFQPYFPDSSLNMTVELIEGFDYIGIGHYHIAQTPAVINKATVVYPGSTEFTAYNEKEEERGKGFYYVQVDGKTIKPEFIHLKRRRPFLYYTLSEEEIDQTVKQIKQDLERFEEGKKPVIILKGTLKKLAPSDVIGYFKNEGISSEESNLLHINFNLTREFVDTDGVIIETTEENIKEELKKLIGDEQIFSSVVETLTFLKSFDSIDEVKKYLKENPDFIDF
ncbi:DNA repair exonuclease SbcCD nuclease subunit [Persephonella hydrogeniphila]|uniref:DNA repair exonuclease SbcCD nuclease subunit n=1 Tax=Persephonella hydrogeniphila TaxID=198703 RepID=A0A285MZR3_9AQUI|nr:DNA repair exonuclease [Persephonella hydrogeniphila]SNZ02694.1 DNA repair exonuclease SbcCD nuclease subunit [Persephonella hydrogeniphila]